MVAVSAVSSSAVTALKLMSVPQSNSVVPSKAASPINPISVRSLSPGVSDALVKIAGIISGQKADTLAARDGLVRGPLVKLSDLPAADAKELRAFGADSAVKVTAPEISDDDFRAMVLDYAKQSWGDLEGFSDALANGTLKIERASDVPELGLGHVQYDLYKDGNMIGSAGFGAGNFNKDLYLQIQAQGIRQATGAINSHDYYVTWPDATLAKSA